jgi:hypothetical protein
MRTTLTIADDVLDAARSIAESRHQTVGEALSELARAGLRPTATGRTRNGLPLLPTRARGAKVTLEMVNALRDEEP